MGHQKCQKISSYDIFVSGYDKTRAVSHDFGMTVCFFDVSKFIHIKHIKIESFLKLLIFVHYLVGTS